jgi:alkylresorcinol/alkylpyrone synthase
MTRIVAVHGVLPPHRYEQSEITDAFAEMCSLPPGKDRNVLERLHRNSTVRSRHIALPLERFAALNGFGESNDAFIEAALPLGQRAVVGALDRSGLRPEDIDLVVSTTVTGIAAPSLEARLAGPLGLRPDVKRVPLFGLGCAAGAAGLARLHDYLEGHPGQVALLLSVELCSLTLQRTDSSMTNLVAGALFGDGAAAVIAVGREHPLARQPRQPTVVFRIVLGADLPDLVRRCLGDEVRGFLADHGLTPADITGWICHAGGPLVLDAVRETLELPAEALELTRHSLAEVGNLSSASVLHMLRDTLDRPVPPPPGTPGLMLAMGPGFSTELVLLRW